MLGLDVCSLGNVADFKSALFHFWVKKVQVQLTMPGQHNIHVWVIFRAFATKTPVAFLMAESWCPCRSRPSKMPKIHVIPLNLSQVHGIEVAVGRLRNGGGSWPEKADFRTIYTPGSSNIAGWKMGDPEWVDVFPIRNGDVPASYVSLPEGNLYSWADCKLYSWLEIIMVKTYRCFQK